MEQTLEYRIRQRAYEIWHAEGCAEGKAHEHWLTAERELLSSSFELSLTPEATARKGSKSTRATRRATKAAKTSAAA